jgi:hypothetical protein
MSQTPQKNALYEYTAQKKVAEKSLSLSSLLGRLVYRESEVWGNGKGERRDK